MRHCGKVDQTQHAIVATLRALGATVVSLANVGGGVPDLLVGHRGRALLVECKSKGGRLTPMQRVFRLTWRGGPVVVVQNPEQAVMLLTGEERT